MAYQKQAWVDGHASKTPVTAARLGVIELGLEAAARVADAASTAVAQARTDITAQAGTLATKADKTEVAAIRSAIPARIETYTTNTANINGGSYATWGITFSKPFAATPTVNATVVGVEFKGAATVYQLTNGGCRVRVDNSGTAAGAVGVHLTAMGS